MDHLDRLESQSICIFCQAFNRFDKDSHLMMWLARKGFFGDVPFPISIQSYTSPVYGDHG